MYIPVTMLAVSISPAGALPSLKLELAELKGTEDRSLGQGLGGKAKVLRDGARWSHPMADLRFGL